MKKYLVINGPNINMLGKRETSLYGTETLIDIENKVKSSASILDVEVSFYQSNFEGSLVEFIQENSSNANGIIINPAGLTVNGYALLDACLDSNLPIVEVHLSNIGAREEWRQASLFSSIAKGVISGFKSKGYVVALEFLIELNQ